jgi:pimeloyl-ACP methyl ester carboxylesterase
MELVFADTKQKFMRIYLDLPGMGRSKAGAAVRNSDDVLEVILAFIDRVIPNRKFLVAGKSYGSYLARGLVQKKRDLVLGLLFICPLVYPGCYRTGEVPEKTVLEKDEALLASLSDDEKAQFEYITIVQNERVWNRFKENIYDALVNQGLGFAISSGKLNENGIKQWIKDHTYKRHHE